MITHRDATATKISGMTEIALIAELATRGYNMDSIYTYIADAKRNGGNGTVHLLGLETIRHNQLTGKFSLTIPAETEETE